MENTVVNMENPVVNNDMEFQVDAETPDYEAADLLAGEEQQDAETVEQETEVDAPAQDPKEGRLPQQAQEAFGKEMQRIRQAERARYEQMLQADPARTIGHRMLTDLMQRQGVTMEQAAQMVETNFIKAFAEREGVSEHIARMMLSNQQPQQRQPAQGNQSVPDVNARAAQIRQELETAELPDGFDFDEAIQDEDFAQTLLDGAPVKVAAKLYMKIKQANQTAAQAPQKVADQLRARQGLPQPGKPQQPITPKQNFFAMTDEEFFDWERKHGL